MDGTSNHVALRIKAAGIVQLAPTGTGVWMLDKKRLTHRTEAGVLTADIELSALGIKDAEFLAVDVQDNSLLLGEAKDANEPDDDESAGRPRIVMRLNPAGQRMQEFASPGRVRQMIVGLDRAIWMLGNKMLWKYSHSGERLATVELRAATTTLPKLMAVDTLGAWVWLDGNKQLLRIDTDASQQPPVSMSLPRKVDFLAVDARTGDLWAASDRQLSRHGEGGELLQAFDLEQFDIKKPTAMGYDTASRSLWLGHGKGIARFNASALVAHIANPVGVSAVGVSTLALSPTVSISSPADGLHTRDPQPTLSVGLGANCHGENCGFADSYYEGYSLSAKLNGQEIGHLFVRDASAAQRTWRPSSLSDGTHLFVAQAIDALGQRSAAREARFIVDTRAPVVSALQPADGLVTRAPAQMVTGLLNEVSTILLQGQATSLGTMGTTFAFPIVLTEGANPYSLRATDGAGNSSVVTFGYTLDTVAPRFLDLQPVNGMSTTSPRVVVSATVDEDATLRLVGNGIDMRIDGRLLTRTVDLLPGANSFTITATDRAGNESARSFSLTYVAQQVQFPLLEPADGAVFAAPAMVLVRAQAKRADGSVIPGLRLVGTSGRRFDISAGADGLAQISLSELQAGRYVVEAIVSDNGTTATRTIVFSVEPAPEERPFHAAWDALNAALLAGDVAAAKSHLTGTAGAKYGPVFEALLPHMPAIIASYSPIAKMSMSEDHAEFALMRVQEGVKRLYVVGFARDREGSWKVDSM